MHVLEPEESGRFHLRARVMGAFVAALVVLMVETITGLGADAIWKRDTLTPIILSEVAPNPRVTIHVHPPQSNVPSTIDWNADSYVIRWTSLRFDERGRLEGGSGVVECFSGGGDRGTIDLARAPENGAFEIRLFRGAAEAFVGRMRRNS